MEPFVPKLPRHEMGKLHHGLAAAADRQIAKVVAMVDALEERGAADDMIAPLRPRLSYLRPRRPLRFCRLLFMPLDPLIVPAPVWRPGGPTIPRTALQPLSDLVHTALGDEVDAIHALIRGRAVEDADVSLAAGRLLWPAAAEVLAAATHPPHGWSRTGLPPDVCLTLMRHASVILTQTETLNGLYAEVEIGVTLRPELLAPIVAAAAASGPCTLAMMAAIVLARTPEAHKPMIQAGRTLGQHGQGLVRSAIEQGVEVLLCRLEVSSGVEGLVIGSGLEQAGAEVRHIVRLLDCLRAGQGFGHSERAANIARRLDASCRTRFGAGMRREFAEALQHLGADPEPAALVRLEDIARGLHDLKQEARQIGTPELYDMLLLQAAALVKASEARNGLGLIDRVRLVEILAGPDEALAMLEPQQEPETELV